MSASTGATTPPSGTPAEGASTERAPLGHRPASQRRTVLTMCGAYLLMTGCVLGLWLLQP